MWYPITYTLNHRSPKLNTKSENPNRLQSENEWKSEEWDLKTYWKVMKLKQWYIDLVYGEKVTEMNGKVEVDFGFLIFIRG